MQNKRLPKFQYFTDNKLLLKKYLKEKGGVVLEIELPIKDIVDNFTLEIQNFSKRKKVFELVYSVDSKLQSKNKVKWNTKIKKVF